MVAICANVQIFPAKRSAASLHISARNYSIEVGRLNHKNVRKVKFHYISGLFCDAIAPAIEQQRIYLR